MTLIALMVSASSAAQGIIVNEASNGPSGAKEFYELMVVGSTASPTGAVDLHDWIIDDNNGDWEGSVTGVGTAPGYARFDAVTDSANCSSLSSLSPGDLIVVYNGNDPNGNLPADDTTDSNGDGVYVFSAQSSCMKSCSGPPSSSNSGYSSCTTAATPTYASLALRNGGDVAQARNPSAVLYHGFTYGDIATPYPTGSFKVGSGSGSSSTFSFSCGSWFEGANFSKSSATTDTPGAVNDSDNATLRGRIQAGSFNYADLLDPTNCTSLAPALSAEKTVSVWDPDSDGLYSIPGNDVVYSITITNTGGADIDAGTIFLVDMMPPELRFYNDDIDDDGPESDPVIGIDTGSSLTLDYGSDVAFSNALTKPADFAACAYTPTAGYDANVRFICFNPKGSMAAGGSNPSFEIKFRAQIK